MGLFFFAKLTGCVMKEIVSSFGVERIGCDEGTGSNPVLFLFVFNKPRRVRNMNGLLNESRMFIKRNASTILTGIGGAGVIATSVMAVKATPKAIKLLDKAKEEKGENLTTIEKIRVAGPAYIPSALIGISTIVCIFGANAINKRQQAALISAYALLDSSYKEYKNKVIELYGEDTDNHVHEEIAKDKYTGDKKTSDNNKVLFYDEFSGRYFNSSMEDVLKAEYELNKKISVWGGAYLNDLYGLLGIPATDYGDYLGWSASSMYKMYWNQWLDFNHERFEFDDGLECFIISFAQEPIPDFDDY